MFWNPDGMNARCVRTRKESWHQNQEKSHTSSRKMSTWDETKRDLKLGLDSQNTDFLRSHQKTISHPVTLESGHFSVSSQSIRTKSYPKNDKVNSFKLLLKWFLYTHTKKNDPVYANFLNSYIRGQRTVVIYFTAAAAAIKKIFLFYWLFLKSFILLVTR